MSAELLREAASLMRERANGATPGRWVEYASQAPGESIINGVGTEDPEVEVCALPRTPQGSQDSWHIHSWHPLVAFSVAELLESEARRAEDWPWAAPHVYEFDEATLDVARAYLGRDS